MAEEIVKENVASEELKNTATETKTTQIEDILKLKDDNHQKLMEETIKQFDTKLKAIQDELDKTKLDKMSEKERAEFLINKQVKDAEEKTAQLLTMLENERKEKEELKRVQKEKDFREKMQKLAAEKPWLAEELPNVKSDQEYEVWIKPREDKLKRWYELDMKDKNAGGNAFSGYKTTTEVKELTLAETIQARLALRIKAGK